MFGFYRPHAQRAAIVALPFMWDCGLVSGFDVPKAEHQKRETRADREIQKKHARIERRDGYSIGSSGLGFLGELTSRRIERWGADPTPAPPFPVASRQSLCRLHRWNVSVPCVSTRRSD